MIVTTVPQVAADAIIRGELVAIPTETVYGLGADALNDQAVEKIFAVKGRPRTHPLIVHIADTSEISRYADHIPQVAYELCKRFWPGPLTVLLRRKPEICAAASGGLPTIALRCPDHDLTLTMLRAANTGVAAPSANLFGRVSPTTADHVAADLGDAVGVILDGGWCSIGVESTIVDCTTDPPAIVRAGGITRGQIEATVGPTTSASTTAAPGTLPSHYSPKCLVVLAADNEDAVRISKEQLAHKRSIRVIDYGRDVDLYAHNLYEDLRSCDRDGIDVAVAVLPPDEGIGAAVRDRLVRAAHSE